MTAVIRTALLLAKSETPPKTELVNLALRRLDRIEEVRALLVQRLTAPGSLTYSQRLEIERWLGLEDGNASAQD